MKTGVLLLMLASLVAAACGADDNEIQKCLAGLCRNFDFGKQFLQKSPSQGRQLSSTTNDPKLTTTQSSDGINNEIANILVKSDTFHSIHSEEDGAKIARLVASREPKHCELTAKCFRQYKPEFTQMPAVHFFSHESHVPSTRGCSQNLELVLKPTNGKELSLSPELDTVQIKRQLIDTNLFNPDVDTFFIVHGFMASWNYTGWTCKMKDLILDKSDANVFIVDWAGGTSSSNPISYVKAVSNTAYVGALLGEFIRSLVEISGQPNASSYQMIGHSLGAHIAGFAGYYLEGTLGHITGLDPAGVCFTACDKMTKTATEDGYLNQGHRRLSRKSAQSVLVLHTDASLFGLKQNCGHYDVYVNGGHEQPDCDPNMDPVNDYSLNDHRGPFASPFNIGVLFKFPEFFNDRLACRHVYAHKILNQFASMLDRKALRGDRVRLESERQHRCQPIAFQCSSWREFKAGECGICPHKSLRCVFIGIQTFSEQLSGVSDDQASQPPLMEQQSMSLMNPFDGGDVFQSDDDDQFNDEEEGSPEKLLEEEHVAEHSNGKYFIRSGKSPVTCMYSYQIVIAAKRQTLRQAKQSRRHFYYLHIPLERSGRLTDTRDRRLNDRLIQVSHRINPKSAAYNSIKASYSKSLTKGWRLDDIDDLDFYTALITFEPVTEEGKCGPGDSTNGAGRKDKWQICSPLDNIKEARLWSSSRASLDAVAWVGMNYMSGFDFGDRLRDSYLFGRFVGEAVRVRGRVHESNRPFLTKNHTFDESNPLISTITGAVRSLDCFLSVFDSGSEGDARRKFKCERSNQELLYAIRLKPNRLGDK